MPVADEANKIGGGNGDGAAGLASAVASLVEEAGPMLFADPEQVELALGDGPRDGHRIRMAVDEVRRRGVGRPRGATNKRTGKMRDYLASRYRHPLETLAEMQAQTPELLAAQLNCTKLEAAALIKSAAAELAPYMESKMPVAVTGNLDGHMTLIMQSGPAPIDGGTLKQVGETPPVLSFAIAQEIEENQRLSASRDEVSE